MIRYFVSAALFESEGSRAEFGNCMYQSEKPITTLDQIRAIEETLEATRGMEVVIVLNFQRIEEAVE